MVAAGDTPGNATLYVPGRRASGLSAHGSLDPLEFDKDYIQARLADYGFDSSQKSAFRKRTVRVKPLDQLGLNPQMIKLDVEGFESQALKGLERTIKIFLPVLLIEVNNRERWLTRITSLGYGLYHYLPDQCSFKAAKDLDQVLNLFCIHPESPGDISKKLQQMIRT